MSQTRAGRSGSEEEPEPEGPESEGVDSGETGTGPTDGFQSPAGDPPGSGQTHECLEWCPICRSHELLKGVTSPEVRQQLQSIQSEALHVFRAFAAAYTERASEDPAGRKRDSRTRREGDGPDEPVVTDISID